jgi:DNA-directed RNA polymerase subunit M/transcription elongation factor TFIIS
MKVKCPNCSSIFQPGENDEGRISRALERNQKLVMMDCPVCYKSIPVHSDDLMVLQASSGEQIIDCPICCSRIVSYVEDDTEKFWGCGECGNVWFSKRDLDNAIRKE